MQSRHGLLLTWLGAWVLLVALSEKVPCQFHTFDWARRVATTTDTNDEFPIGMALGDEDPEGEPYVHVTGWFDGTNNFGGQSLTSIGGLDIFVAKYDSSGSLRWVRQAGGASADAECGIGRDTGRGIGVDDLGNVYVTGGFAAPSADFGPTVGGGVLTLAAPGISEFFLAKYDRNGTVQWCRQSNGGRDCGVYGTGIAVDGAGNSYVVGFADNGAPVTFQDCAQSVPPPNPPNCTLFSMKGGYSTFLVKYDNGGAVQWAQLLEADGHAYAIKVALDDNGEFVYVAGEFIGVLTIGNLNAAGPRILNNFDNEEEMFVAKFVASTGDLVWVQRSEGDDVTGMGVAVDSEGDVYVSGAFGEGSLAMSSCTPNPCGIMSAGGLFDAFLAKLNGNDGSTLCLRRAGGGGVGVDVFMDVAVDGQDNVHAAGVLSPGVADCGPGGATMVKYDSNCATQWANSATGPHAQPDGKFALGSFVAKCAVDRAGNGYLAGWYLTQTTFGNFVLQPQGHWSLFLAKQPPLAAATQGFIRGHVNSDCSVDITDAIVILDVLFGGRGTLDCHDAADVNDDGFVDISDAVRILLMLAGRPPPPMPYPNRGPDPTADDLGCLRQL